MSEELQEEVEEAVNLARIRYQSERNMSLPDGGDEEPFVTPAPPQIDPGLVADAPGPVSGRTRRDRAAPERFTAEAAPAPRVAHARARAGVLLLDSPHGQAETYCSSRGWLALRRCFAQKLSARADDLGL